MNRNDLTFGNKYYLYRIKCLSKEFNTAVKYLSGTLVSYYINYVPYLIFKNIEILETPAITKLHNPEVELYDFGFIIHKVIRNTSGDIIALKPTFLRNIELISGFEWAFPLENWICKESE